MATDPFDSIHSYVDAYSGMGVSDGIGYTLAPPATRKTARFGIRRPRHNTYASLIHSQASVLPTDPTRANRPRTACRRGAGCTSAANDILESKELMCGDCLEPIRGPGQAAWVSAYDKRDELQQLLIDSEARDALIAKAYKDLAAQSYQSESKPVLCKALARLYQHDSGRPLRANPNWSDEDWKVAKWYSKNCYPYQSAAGSVMWYERPLVPKSWIDNVVRTLGPIYDYQSRCCMEQVGACPCAPESGERGVYPRMHANPAPLLDSVRNCAGSKPTQNELARAERQSTLEKQSEWQAQNQANTLQHFTGNIGAPSHQSGGPYARAKCMSEYYALMHNNRQGAELRAKQAALVADQRRRLDAANSDYADRVYQAQVRDYRSVAGQKQTRMTQMLDPNVGAFN